MNINSWRL